MTAGTPAVAGYGTASSGVGSSSVGSSWVAAEFGILLGDRDSPVGLRMTQLIEVGLRRNPRRAQLLVSTVLGKHLAADPRLITGIGRLLGALVGRTLDGLEGPAPKAWAEAAAQAVSGGHPGALLALFDGEPEAGPGAESAAPGAGVLTFGFAETATALGHLVADQLGSAYLHSTRRRDGAVPVAAEFAEPHSHATGHLLRPDPADLLHGGGPVVLVDDELSTGRTALNVIEALHAIAPRNRYVLAGLVDVRSDDDDRNRADLADRLGCRIDVVSLVRGTITVPAGTVDRVAAELAATPAPTAVQRREVTHSRVDLSWTRDVPTAGRHGFLPTDRVEFDDAVRAASVALEPLCGESSRILVLGTEELMYLPLRLARELARDPLRSVVFQSTTRSPVHAIDRPGYPVRRRIDFVSSIVDEAERPVRNVYNAGLPSSAGSFTEPELIVVVDDGHAVDGPGGVAESIAAATGVPVLLAALHPRPRR
jgi:hypothetical protein